MSHALRCDLQDVCFSLLVPPVLVHTPLVPSRASPTAAISAWANQPLGCCVNKKQRKQRRLRRRRQQERSRARGRRPTRTPAWAGQRPWQPVSLGLHQFSLNPALAPEDLRVALRKSAEAADEAYRESCLELPKWFEEYDALSLLAYCARYFVSHPEGTTPEASGKLDFYPHYLEILQAFAVAAPRSASDKPLAGAAEDLLEFMGRLGDSASERSFFADLPEDALEFSQHRLLSKIRSETAAVRNWAYPHQMAKVTRDLAATTATDFLAIYGFDPRALLDAFDTVHADAEDRLNAHIEKVRSFYNQKTWVSVADSFRSHFPTLSGLATEEGFNACGRSFRPFRALLVAASDLFLPSIYTFDIHDIANRLSPPVDQGSFAKIFSNLSFSFGDLVIKDTDHIFLDNPVWARPFIRVREGIYFSSLIGLLPHYSLSILERLVAEEPSLEATYRPRKSKYLEDEVFSLFKKNFKGAELYRQSKWASQSGDANGENDLTVLVDSVAFVIEAKSGLISPAAARGAPKSLRETVKRLVEEPASQAHDFIRVLQSGEVHTFETESGTVNKIDVSNVRDYIPLTVTLSQLGSLANISDFVEAEITPKSLEELSSVISLTDLDTIFTILDLEAEKVHYLGRRRELDAHVSWSGDEIDCLAFYLQCGFNIGEDEFERKASLELSPMSIMFDLYFLGKDSGRVVERPGLGLAPMWRAWLETLEERRTERWLDASLVLLNVHENEQKRLEKVTKNLASHALRGKVKKGCEVVALVTGPSEREFYIAVYPHRRVEREARNHMIASVLDGEEAKACRGAVCVGIDVERPDLPYVVLALREETTPFAPLQG